MFFNDEPCKTFVPIELVEHGDRSQAHHLLRVPLPRGSEALICLVFKEFYVRMTWGYYPRCGACVVVRNAMAVRSSQRAWYFHVSTFRRVDWFFFVSFKVLDGWKVLSTYVRR